MKLLALSLLFFYVDPSLTHADEGGLKKIIAVQQAQIQKLTANIQSLNEEITKLKGTEIKNLEKGLSDLKSTSMPRSEMGSSYCPKIHNFSDSGYGDSFRGVYLVGGCLVFCRWVGNSGSGGDPSVRTTYNQSRWTCVAPGKEYQYFSGRFPYRKISF